MSFVRLSAPRPEGISPGSAKSAKANVYIAYAEDIIALPPRDSKGVKMLGNVTFKPGRHWEKVYLTPSKQDRSWESDGEADAISINHKFVGDHPGDELQSMEFIQQWLGRDVIIGIEFCDNSPSRIIGTLCAPLQMKPSFTGNNERTGTTLTFESEAKTNLLPGVYFGDFLEGTPFEVTDNTALVLSESNGTQYLLAPDTNGDSIAVTSNDLEHGTLVSFIGQGGSDPSTLSSGSNILLVEGSQWVALKDSVINFEVFKGGGTTYLIERSRA